MPVVLVSVPKAVEILAEQLDAAEAAIAAAIGSQSLVAIVSAANFHLSVAKQIAALDAAAFAVAA